MHRRGPESRLADSGRTLRFASSSGKIIHPGHCRVCDCTDDHPCVDENGVECCWVDADHTLCDNLECLARVPISELEQLRPLER